ncbi:MAG TPA: hypothetical protein VGP94_13180, partial [Tepidisphaeraceae bacterium]|nr:hypothetical protein [Tepidisphaeraceae bacterium]
MKLLPVLPILLLPALALAQYPTSDFPISFSPDAPGLLSASHLLPKPAGKDGPIVARDGHFYSGQNRIRFWGVNIAFGGNFPTHQEADKLAARLSNFGINAVRFHHMDAYPYPAGIFADQSLSKLSDEALDRLDYFIAALKKQGIYSNINLHVSRQYARPHKWENADKLENYDKIVDIFHPELIEANKQYATDLLTHVNKYTNTRLADEPAVCMVEINNEDTIFFWGGVQKLANLPQPYAGVLQKQWNEWLLREYKSRDGILAAWQKEDSLAPDEDPLKGTVARGILKNQTPSHPRSIDWYRFLQATDQKYFGQMHNYLKKQLGVKSPITGTIALGPLGALSQSHMDFVDAHAYWDHPRFPRRQWDMKDWEIKNTAMSDVPTSSALWGLAASRIAGKPFTVTEYNHAAPNEYQSECIPIIASFAAMQDWDAVFLFAYTHNAKYEKPKMESFFDIEGNPLKMPLMPLGSRIFLGQCVTRLSKQSTKSPQPAEMFSTGARFHSDFWGFIRQTQKVNWQDFLQSRFAVSFSDVLHAMESEPGPKATWETKGDPGTGYYTVISDRAIIFTGFPQNKTIDLPPLKLTDVENPFISLILLSDDGKPLRESSKLLLALVGRGGNKDMGWNERRKSISDQWGKAPPQIELIKARLSLASSKS